MIGLFANWALEIRKRRSDFKNQDSNEGKKQVNILWESNLRIIVSIKVFWGADTWPRFIGIFEGNLAEFCHHLQSKERKNKMNRYYTSLEQYTDRQHKEICL